MATINSSALNLTSMSTMRELEKFIKTYNANSNLSEDERRKAIFAAYDGLLTEDEYNRLVKLSKSITKEGVIPDIKLWNDAKAEFREIGNNKIKQAKEKMQEVREKKAKLASLKNGQEKTSIYRAQKNVEKAEKRHKMTIGLKLALAILLGAAGAVLGPVILGLVGVTAPTALALSTMVGVSFGALGGVALGEKIEEISHNSLEKKRAIVDENEKEIQELEDEIGRAEENIRALEDQYETEIFNTVPTIEDLDRDFKPEPIIEEEKVVKSEEETEKEDNTSDKDKESEPDNKDTQEKTTDKNVIKDFDDITKFVDEAFDGKSTAPLTDEELDEIINISKDGIKQAAEPKKDVDQIVVGSTDTRPEPSKIETITKEELEEVDKEVNKKKYELEEGFKKDQQETEQKRIEQEKLNSIINQCENAVLIGATVFVGSGRESNNAEQILGRITETHSSLGSITNIEDAEKALAQLKDDVSSLKVCAMRNEKEQEAKKVELSSSAKEREQKFGKTVEDYRNHRKKVSGDGFVNLNEVKAERIEITDDNYLKAAGELDKLMEADAMLTEIKGKGGLSKTMQSKNDISKTIGDNVRVLANSIANYETEVEINDSLRLEELLKMDESLLSPQQKDLLKAVGKSKTKSTQSENEE